MLTIGAIKADMGSMGGHTRSSVRMMEIARKRLDEAVEKGPILSFDVAHTGDDICLLMIQQHGENNPVVYNLAWTIFEAEFVVHEMPGKGI